MSKSTRFVGLDDSKDSIEVAVAESGREGEVRRFGLISNTPAALRKLVRQLGRPKTLHFVYEAGPSGYGIHRELVSLGANCIVAAPTKTPRRSGDQIKSDRRDAGPHAEP
jgi:transposase